MLFKTQMRLARNAIRIRVDCSFEVLDLPAYLALQGSARCGRCDPTMFAGFHCLHSVGLFPTHRAPLTLALTASSCGRTYKCPAVFSPESGEGSKLRSGRKRVNGTLVPYREWAPVEGRICRLLNRRG